MTIIQSSGVCRFFMMLWTALVGAWEGSGLCRAFQACERGIAGAVRGSGVCWFLWRDGTLPKSWPQSITCTVLSVILNLPCAICRWLYRLGKGLWDGSVCFQALSAMGGAAFLFLGLFMAVMLMAPHSLWNNLYGLFGAVAVAGLFAVGCASRPKNRIETADLGPYYILFMAFICYAFLTSLSWRLSVRFVGFHLAAFLIAVLVVSTVKSYEQLQTLAVTVLAGVTVAALYGCYQGVIGVEVVANQQDMVLNAGMPGRVYSFFDNPNNFGEILVMLMPLDYALFLNAKTFRGKMAALVSFGICGIALAFTYFRSGWIGLVLATLVFVAFWNWKLIPLFILLGLCCIPLLPETIYNRILTIGNKSDSSLNYRFAIYEASGVLLKDYWWRGVGLGSDVLTQTFKNYPTMFDGNYPIHTHNNYLQMWAETGILGMTAFLSALLYQLKAGLKAYTAATDRRLKNLLAAALAGFCGILVISVPEYTWFYARNMFVYFFLFGIIGACVKLARRSVKAGR